VSPKGTGLAWFDLDGSGILVISVLFGGWIIAQSQGDVRAIWQLVDRFIGATRTQ